MHARVSAPSSWVTRRALQSRVVASGLAPASDSLLVAMVQS